MTMCFMFEKGLPKSFWVEVLNTTVYLQNSLSKEKTPFEGYFGFKPSIAHLKIFCCNCYARVLAVKRDKLEKKVQPGIFMGYTSNKKGL